MNGNSHKKLTGAGRLREMLADPNKTISAPGVYDGLTARLALAAGFDCLYMTGAGTSMSRLGWADIGLTTFNDMVSQADMICNLNPSIPVIADADTGYGGPVAVARTTAAYARAGVAALHLEDQVQQKRCGHLSGKQLVPREVYYSRLRAAIMARDQAGSEMCIIARTDARAGEGLEEAVRRLTDAADPEVVGGDGVDILFLEALKSHEEMREACQLLKKTGKPMLLNMVGGGQTPATNLKTAGELGFQIVIFPGVCLEEVVQSVTKGLQSLKETERLPSGTGAVRKAFELCGLQDAVDLDKAAGGTAYDEV